MAEKRGLRKAPKPARLTKAEFEAHHVFFQKEDADIYIGKILTKIAASAIATPVSPSSS
jgi:hypothetical protein